MSNVRNRGVLTELDFDQAERRRHAIDAGFLASLGI